MITTEMAWFLCPILSMLRQFDGTWGTFRWAMFAIMILSSFLFKQIKNAWGLSIIIYCAILIMLPITLIGDSIPGHWINWIWVWVLGYLNGLWIAPLYVKDGHSYEQGVHKVFIWALIPAAIYGISISLSNIPSTAGLFQWKLVEGLMGFSLGIPFALMVNDRK